MQVLSVQGAVWESQVQQIGACRAGALAIAPAMVMAMAMAIAVAMPMANRPMARSDPPFLSYRNILMFFSVFPGFRTLKCIDFKYFQDSGLITFVI